MGKVTFTEEGHVYKHGDDRYESVSRVLQNFQKPYPRDHWLSYKALKELLGEEFTDLKREWLDSGRAINDPELIEFCSPFIEGKEKEFNAIKQWFADEWDKKNKKSIVRGNKYHESRENSSYIRGYEINPFDFKKYPTYQKERIKGYNESICDCLNDLESGFYPELLIWNHEHKIAGQADKVFIEQVGQDKMFDLDDYKTNKKMSKTAFWFKNYGYVMLEPPIDHLQDSKLQKYELQLSLYAWMLEQQGLKLRHLALHHLNQRYDLTYRKDEIEDILDHRRKFGITTLDLLD